VADRPNESVAHNRFWPKNTDNASHHDPAPGFAMPNHAVIRNSFCKTTVSSSQGMHFRLKKDIMKPEVSHVGTHAGNGHTVADPGTASRR
jgi:hypothetical protein